MTRLATPRGPAGRVALLLGLLIAAGVSLRGHLPTPHQGPRDPSSDGGSLTGVVALLSVSMLVMAFAMLNRRTGPPRPPAREFPEGPRGRRGGWNLRLGLIAVGLLIVWLIALVVLNRLGVGPESREIQLPDAPPDSTDAATSATSPTVSPPTRSDTYRLLMATTAALMIMMAVATVLSAMRRPRQQALPLPGGEVVTAAAGPEPLAVAAERGLAEVANPNLAPREAIIACYAAMETALTGAPGAAPLASDTPSEVLAQAVGSRTIRADSASRLVDLFAEARFSGHVMTEDHRTVAEQALRSVLAELRSAA